MSIRFIGPIAQDSQTSEQIKDYTLNTILATDIAKLHIDSRDYTNLFSTLNYTTAIKDSDRIEFALTTTSQIINLMSKLMIINHVTLPQIHNELSRVETKFDVLLVDLDTRFNTKITNTYNTIHAEYDLKLNDLYVSLNSKITSIDFSIDATVSDLYNKYISLKARIEKLEIASYI
jgi:hypothetical protein